jgi:hypothetical protein
MTTKNTHAPTTRAHQAVADDKKAGRTDSTLRKILAGQRAKQAEDANKNRGAGPDPRRDDPRREGSSDAKHDGDKPGERDAEWARHVEWTLRLMS